MDPQANGKLVHVSGMMQPTTPARDPVFGVTGDGLLRLSRAVEMYQWKETTSSQSQQSVGGSKTTETTYTYQRVWSEQPIASAQFKVRDGHQNPPMQVRSATFNAGEVKLGAYRVDPSLLNKLATFTPLQAQSRAAGGLPGVGRRVLPGPEPGPAGDRRCPGDTSPPFRRRPFRSPRAQSNGVLTAYRDANGYTIALAEPGVVTAAALFHDEQKSESRLTWILRGVGFVAMLIGFVCMTRPLTMVFAVLPFLESLVGAGRLPGGAHACRADHAGDDRGRLDRASAVDRRPLLVGAVAAMYLLAGCTLGAGRRPRPEQRRRQAANIACIKVLLERPIRSGQGRWQHLLTCQFDATDRHLLSAPSDRHQRPCRTAFTASGSQQRRRSTRPARSTPRCWAITHGRCSPGAATAWCCSAPPGRARRSPRRSASRPSGRCWTRASRRSAWRSASAFPPSTTRFELCRDALALGLTQVLALPPYFYRDVTEDGLFDAYASLVDQVGNDRLRLTLYNIPQVSGVRVPPGVAARLRARYGQVIAGVKDSSADFAQFLAFRAAAPDLAVTVGAEPDIGRALAEGGAGTICGMGNVAPDLVRAMFRAEPAGRADAGRLWAGPRPVHCAAESHAGGAKRQAGWLNVRPPLRPATLADGIAAPGSARRADATMRRMMAAGRLAGLAGVTARFRPAAA